MMVKDYDTCTVMAFEEQGDAFSFLGKGFFLGL